MEQPELIEITVRAPATTAAMARTIGNDGCITILAAHVLTLEAEQLAEVDDERCLACLIEASYLYDLVTEFVMIQSLLKAEAEALNL